MAAVERCVAWLMGRRGAVLVLAAAWVAFIVISAGTRGDGDGWLGLPNLDWLSYVLVAFIALGALMVILALALVRGPPTPGKRRKRALWPLVVFALIMLAFGRLPQEPLEGAEAVETTPTEQEPDAVAGAEQSDGIGAGQLTILLFMFGAASLILLLTKGRQPFLEDPDPTEEPDEEPATADLEQALKPALQRAGDHLLTEGDPRTAVLLAYADLEAALTNAGQPPADHETPTEHLQRTMAHLTIDAEPLTVLARLYQRARFSAHAITPADQRNAADALRNVQRQLAPTP